MVNFRLFNSSGHRLRGFNAAGAEVFFPDADQGGVIEPIGPLNPVTGSITAYANEAETDALLAAMTVDPTARRQRTIDAAVKRLKAAGVWSKLRALYMVGADQQASRLNWKNPAEALTVVGAPEFTANIGWRATGSGQALNTGIAPSALARNDAFHGVWCKGTDANGVATGSDNPDYGSVMGGVGISLCVRNAASGSTARTQGAQVTAVPAEYSDGYGFTAARRSAAGGSTGLRNGVAMPVGSDASAAPISQPITLLAATVDGALSAAYSPRQQAAWAFGAGLTDQEAQVLTGVIATYLDALEYGEVDLTPAGLGPETVTADVVCYGTTANSVTAALQAARAGASVVIIGGWRDHHIGGMSAGGLGLVDYLNGTFNQGLPRWINNRARAMSHGSAHLRFACNQFARVMREILDPARNGGFEIPVYFSSGVSEATMDGTDIASIVTVDGRTISAKQWVDGSYEGDLMIAAGVSWRMGREPVGPGPEAVGGYRGVNAGNGSGSKQIRDDAGTLLRVDPWQEAGDHTSGMLDGLTGIYSEFTPALHDQPAIGAADDELQAYNFRLSWGTDPARFAPLPSTPPADFDPARFEVLLRHLALAPGLQFADLFKPDSVFTGAYDINTGPGFSTDWIGMSKAYPGASYAEREAIWQGHWNYILGLFYVLQHHPDARVPAGLRAEALTWGMRTDHYHDPYPGDGHFVQPQLYVREAARMMGMAVGSGDNLTVTNNTASIASYPFDHHVMTAIAYEYEAGNWMVWCEGGWLQGMGGSDNASSVPMEIYMPKVSDCTNLSVTFATSLTTVAFGSVRMEITAMQAGQTMGQAAAMAAAAGTSIQATDYAALQAALLDSAAPRLPGETAPALGVT